MIEVICSGFGGQGVLVAGMILADAGMEDNKQVSWYPSYGFEMRGGAANCDVKISDEEIPSPFCLEPDIVYTLNETAIDTYESRLKPGGVLLVNSSLVPDERTYRDDIQVIKVPATTIADELGNPKGTNIVMLGALACASDLYDEAAMRHAVEHYFGKKGKVNPKNAQCFDRGADEARKQLYFLVYYLISRVSIGLSVGPDETRGAREWRRRSCPWRA